MLMKNLMNIFMKKIMKSHEIICQQIMNIWYIMMKKKIRKLQEISRSFIKFHGLTGKQIMKFHEITWSEEYLCSFVKLHGISWNMKPWNSMKMHVFMKFHEMLSTLVLWNQCSLNFITSWKVMKIGFDRKKMQ
jgi:hypothetical protein